jgi:NAD(P)-dependent dehydrogenase (short-subunit alcohol dehydrogenase family)
MGQFDGKVVLVTGGNAGIGRATALAFAREGAKVVVAARRELQGQETAELITRAGGTASFVRADVAVDADVKAAVDFTVKKYGKLDVLFNNAGIEGKNGPIDTLTAADFDETFSVNVKGTWLAMKHALPHLVKTKGNIVNNSSVVASVGMANMSIYTASKGAIDALTRSAAIEFIASGVRVNAVSPGPVVTDMAMRLFGSEENVAGFAKGRVPAGVAGHVDDIAQTVLHLASPGAKFVVGQILSVDGGVSAQ